MRGIVIAMMMIIMVLNLCHYLKNRLSYIHSGPIQLISRPAHAICHWAVRFQKLRGRV